VTAGAPGQGGTFWFTVRLQRQADPDIAACIGLAMLTAQVVDSNDSNRAATGATVYSRKAPLDALQQALEEQAGTSPADAAQAQRPGLFSTGLWGLP